MLVLISIACAGCTLPSDPVPVPATESVAVVFDIDGTLTPTPAAIFDVREHAAQAVTLHANANIHIIYLSARVAAFQSQIPKWLKKHAFPNGSIHVPQTGADRGDHAGFKLRVLNEYSKNGWRLIAAYGDSTTDFEAYNNANISRIYALRRSGNETCKKGVWQKCIDSWSDHFDDINDILANRSF